LSHETGARPERSACWVSMKASTRRAFLFASAILAVLLGGASSARAQFEFVAQSAIFNPPTGEVFFTVVFNQPPDFANPDEFGRTPHSFQHFIFEDPTLPFPDRFQTIIRGSEIHLTGGDRIRIRRAGPPVDDPDAGGWGELLTEVPFELDGATLTFAVPLEFITPESTSGRFEFELMSTEFGAMTKLSRRRSKVQTIVAPDYVVTQVSNPPPSARNGETFSITATVQNAGNLAAAAPTTTRYFLSLDQRFAAGDRAFPQRATVPALAIGASNTQTVSLRVPPNLASGTYFVLACADRTAAFAELTKRNNCTASATTVTVAP
jgi:hypothetical protein